MIQSGTTGTQPPIRHSALTANHIEETQIPETGTNHRIIKLLIEKNYSHGKKKKTQKNATQAHQPIVVPQQNDFGHG